MHVLALSIFEGRLGLSVVNKDLTFKAKAKAKDLTSQTSSKTAFDKGVFTVFEC